MLSDQLVNILLFLVLVLIVLTVLFYGAIFLTYSSDNPLVLGLTGPVGPEGPSIGSNEPVEKVPTYPATWTPTPTQTPAPTGTPTETRTPTSTATPTSTPTPVPTRTATPTNTPPPTSTFTPAPSPTPLPYFVEYERHQNCFDIGMYGVVEDQEGFPKGGVVVEYGEQGISRFTATTDASGRYALALIVANKDLAKRPHTWFIRVIEDGKPASDTFTWQSDSIETCDSRLSAQVMEINFFRRF
jgi:hypothetical protein